MKSGLGRIDRYDWEKPLAAKFSQLAVYGR
jgi:hypothetical protein